ncbi:MAG TPA: sulfite exporter TauE/SafE family protein [Acidimicrobiales bacterium]|jgi:hypothetical protein
MTLALALLTGASGLVIGVLMGLFGVGGSSVATPVLSLLGVPALAAVASPLPATIPAATLAARRYITAGEARTRAAAWSLVGGIPGTVVGALLSQVVGGSALLLASGIALVAVGTRIIRPISDVDRASGGRRRQNRPLLIAACATVGLLTGLLANGGGFLFVPLYLLVFGLRMRQAVGTSLLVIAVLSMPTLATHWALGHVNWSVATAFAGGLLPGAAVGGHIAHLLPGPSVRRSFGWFLAGFGVLFTVYRLA